ncbi:hypothetical protein H6P81_000369 [Aristolochia fimbriata]|uniref:DNA-3-methyladenine glycosylase I n=1 Tax=Aristolochia fimbriata TaxID=158543 RepID=A0AAV7F6Y2_ARIFI|nr:hypothetical protein H6P81_000369 [Aristolochia fimbriata]
MSGAPRVRSMNVAESEARPVLGPAGNKTGSFPARKPASKPLRKAEGAPEVVKEEKKAVSPRVHGSSPPPVPSLGGIPSILRRHEQFLHCNLSLNASCSSDASTDSVQSRASTGRIARMNTVRQKRKQSSPKPEKVVPDNISVSSQDSVRIIKKRCAWVTPNTDPLYAAFHDEEWGVPVREDKKLFELLVLSGALAELTWPAILSKRHIFREVFLNFEPASVAKMNEKRLVAPGSTALSLLSEPKLRAIIENARQILKIIEEFGSFDKYCWSFVNHKPIMSRFRYPRQVPVRTPKADFISKDLVKRGFRCVGPTVIYTFMQAAGITIDHLISCYRFDECAAAASGVEESRGKDTVEDKKVVVDDIGSLELVSAIDEVGISQ